MTTTKDLENRIRRIWKDEYSGKVFTYGGSTVYPPKADRLASHLSKKFDRNRIMKMNDALFYFLIDEYESHRNINEIDKRVKRVYFDKKFRKNDNEKLQRLLS